MHQTNLIQGVGVGKLLEIRKKTQVSHRAVMSRQTANFSVPVEIWRQGHTIFMAATEPGNI